MVKRAIVNRTGSNGGYLDVRGRIFLVPFEHYFAICVTLFAFYIDYGRWQQNLGVRANIGCNGRSN
jgi:hypothetical protein